MSRLHYYRLVRRRHAFWYRFAFGCLASISIHYLSGSSPNFTGVTCSLAYYAQWDVSFNPNRELHLINPATLPTNRHDIVVDGLVLTLHTPTARAGNTICIWLDRAQSIESVWCKPRTVYAGRWPEALIGTLAFRGELPFDRIYSMDADPSATRSPEDLERLLRDNHWYDELAAKAVSYFGKDYLFNALFMTMAHPNQVDGGINDQRFAAQLLVQYQPCCNVPLRTALKQTLRSWDESVSDWPLFLWRAFGRDAICEALNEIRAEKLSKVELDKLDYWDWWLSGTEMDLKEASRLTHRVDSDALCE